MPGLSCIIKKELSDAASNKSFLISCVVLFLICAFTGLSAGNTYYYYRITNPSNVNIELILMNELVPQIRLIGALVAVAYGFNAINKERTEGSLKVLLSYPIYRDQIILGKLLASFFLITFIAFVSLIVSLALYLFSTNIVLSFDQLALYFVFMCLSTLLLSGYLGLSLLFSIVFKDPKKSLIVVFLLINVFNSLVFYSYGRLITDVIYGPEYGSESFLSSSNPKERAIREFIQNLSPADGLKRIVDRLISYRILIFVGNKLVWVEGGLWNVLMDQLNAIMVLVIIPVLSFSASYVHFTRRDIT